MQINTWRRLSILICGFIVLCVFSIYTSKDEFNTRAIVCIGVYIKIKLWSICTTHNILNTCRSLILSACLINIGISIEIKGRAVCTTKLDFSQTTTIVLIWNSFKEWNQLTCNIVLPIFNIVSICTSENGIVFTRAEIWQIGIYLWIVIWSSDVETTFNFYIHTRRRLSILISEFIVFYISGIWTPINCI